MSVTQPFYEELLAEYSNHLGAIALLKQFRPYLEMIPSMRRPSESVIPIPLPLVHIRSNTADAGGGNSRSSREVLRLPCEVGILMCDPEWKIKTGPEIFVFIHRPQEDFSELLGRWRQTQVWLNQGYEWMMPRRHKHILSEGTDERHPLFVVSTDTPERIKRGLRGASLPFVVETIAADLEVAEAIESVPSETLGAED
jgi:hypothetical protein